MFIYQAQASFKIWNNLEPKVDDKVMEIFKLIKVGILGDIGSGKDSFVAKQFGYQFFNADKEVSDIYKNDKSCYNKIKKKFPKLIKSKSLKKDELGNVIRANKKNLKKISDIVTSHR